MRDGGYRDGLGAVRDRIAQRRLQIQQPELFLTPVRRIILGSTTTRAIDDLGARSAARATTLEQLLDVERALDGLAEHYATARRTLATIGARLSPPPAPATSLGSTDGMLRSVFERRMTDLEGTIEEGLPNHALGGRFVADGHPMYALVGYDSTGELRGQLRTTALAVIPSIVTRLETTTDAVLRAVHLREEATVGVRLFDEAFWIEGDEAAARALLVPEVRDALRRLRPLQPRLEVSGGVADLHFRAERIPPSRLVPEAAVAALETLGEVIARALAVDAT